MDDWKKWVIVLAGVAAIANNWVTGYYLDVIGGAVAVIVGFLLE